MTRPATLRDYAFWSVMTAIAFWYAYLSFVKGTL
jgi:hypothetical protein